MARVYWLQGKHEEAETMYPEVANARPKHFDTGYVRNIVGLYNLAWAIANHRGKFEEAQDLIKRAIDMGYQMVWKRSPKNFDDNAEYGGYVRQKWRDRDGEASRDGVDLPSRSFVI